MPLLPYLSVAAVAAGLSYKCYIIRSGPECFPQSQFSVQITSHLATPFCLLSTLLTVTQAAKIPSRQLSHTHTHNFVSPLIKHRTLRPNLVLITTQKAPYKAQLVLRGRWGGEGELGRSD